MTRTRVRYDRIAALVLTVVLLVPVVGGLLGTGASAGERRHTYVVRAGDTLWAIARGLDPKGDPRSLVYELEVANHLDGASITPGQVLRLP